jgi:hypothetical protein
VEVWWWNAWNEAVDYEPGAEQQKNLRCPPVGVGVKEYAA